MKKQIFTLLFLIALPIIPVASQVQEKATLSANYLYLEGYQSHGIGIQSKIRLIKELYLMPDIIYFFQHQKNDLHEKWGRRELESYGFLNINAAYRFRIKERISLLPYAGVGLLYAWTQCHQYSEGSSYSGSGMHYAPYSIVTEDNYLHLVFNVGLALEYKITDKIFITAGGKYMPQTHEKNENYYFQFNAGVGYCF